MEFYDVVRQRRSIRLYDKNRAVPAAAFDRIAEAVNAAPSACNLQPWKVVVYTDPAMLEQICECYRGQWLQSAPAIAVIIGDADKCWVRKQDNRDCLDIDAAIAMDHLILAATAEGLGSCWICAYDQQKLDSLLQLEAPLTTIALTPLGYGTEEPRTFVRKELSEVFEVVSGEKKI